jgi:hypothetical protein
MHGQTRVALAYADATTGDTWWLLDRDALELARQLERAAAEPGASFSLTELDGRAWLTVLAAEHEVRLTFDDDLVRERGRSGVFRLAPPAAVDLAGWLTSAVEAARREPAHLYVAPEPSPRLVAEVD